VLNDRPRPKGAEFWRLPAIADALNAQHFGLFLRAYRDAHTPPLTQAALGRWLGMSQVQVSRLERGEHPPSDLRKLRRWAAALHVPSDLLWFDTPHASDESAPPVDAATVGDVHRRNVLKLAGAAAAATGGMLANAPWQRLADTLGGSRPIDGSAVSMIEARTAGFFRSEETLPARQLIVSLREHHRALTELIDSTQTEVLRRRLITCAAETEALAGWTLFDLQRCDSAERLYRQALDSARQSDDHALSACVLGYWSYLLSTKGDTPGADRLLDDAAERVRGSAAATQSWIAARRAEEKAALGDETAALRSLDEAMTVFDYADSTEQRPWTCFFTPSRLGSLAVSTYGRLSHRDTDDVASSLLASLAPTENKVKALVLADLAVSAARESDYDRVEMLARQSAPLAVRTEASLTIDRLWELVELLPAESSGTAHRTRSRLTEELLATPA
jgi:transcriptional regulator with XRE-family HTH domain